MRNGWKKMKQLLAISAVYLSEIYLSEIPCISHSTLCGTDVCDVLRMRCAVWDVPDVRMRNADEDERCAWC